MALILHKAPSGNRAMVVELKQLRLIHEEALLELKRIKLALYVHIDQDLDKEIV